MKHTIIFEKNGVEYKLHITLGTKAAAEAIQLMISNGYREKLF
jgi:hypothetical protein